MQGVGGREGGEGGGGRALPGRGAYNITAFTSHHEEREQTSHLQKRFPWERLIATHVSILIQDLLSGRNPRFWGPDS